MRARKVRPENNAQAAWIILDDPDRYAGLPLVWAEAWLKRQGSARKPGENVRIEQRSRAGNPSGAVKLFEDESAK